MTSPADLTHIDSLTALRDALRKFAADRDWDQFHSPKNLAMALTVEAAELQENFQWLNESAACTPDPDVRARIRQELADVLLYLVRLADKLNIDLLVAAQDKLLLNTERYPVDKARGSSRKYSDL